MAILGHAHANSLPDAHPAALLLNTPQHRTGGENKTEKLVS